MYCSASSFLSSSLTSFMYFFHPGHQLMCQRQKRPANDFGLLSYLARKPQFSHWFFCFFIFCRVDESIKEEP